MSIFLVFAIFGSTTIVHNFIRMNLKTFGHKEMDKTPSKLQQRLVEVRVKEPVDLEVCNTGTLALPNLLKNKEGWLLLYD